MISAFTVKRKEEPSAGETNESISNSEINETLNSCKIIKIQSNVDIDESQSNTDAEKMNEIPSDSGEVIQNNYLEYPDVSKIPENLTEDEKYNALINFPDVPPNFPWPGEVGWKAKVEDMSGIFCSETDKGSTLVDNERRKTKFDRLGCNEQGLSAGNRRNL